MEKYPVRYIILVWSLRTQKSNSCVLSVDNVIIGLETGDGMELDKHIPTFSWASQLFLDHISEEKFIKYLSILMEMRTWTIAKVNSLECVLTINRSSVWSALASLYLSLFKIHAYVDCQSTVVYNLRTILSEDTLISVLMFPNNWSLKLGSDFHICGITPSKLPFRDITELTTEDLPRRAETNC